MTLTYQPWSCLVAVIAMTFHQMEAIVEIGPNASLFSVLRKGSDISLLNGKLRRPLSSKQLFVDDP